MTKQTRLEDIPFAETLADEPAAPRLRDVLSQDDAKREAARLHWLRHVKDGVLNSVFHHVLKVCPPTFVSGFGNLLVPMMRWSYRDKLFPQRISWNFETLTQGRWSDEADQAAALDRWWCNIGRTISEFCIVNRLWKTSQIEVEGLEHLKNAQSNGAPVIFTSMHLATWEALFVAIHEGLAGPSIGPFQPEPNRFKNRIVHAIRKERNQYLFPPGQRSAYRLHRLMTSGRYSMTIFVDEVRDKQVHLPCFGRPLPTKGNAVVAVKLANSCGGTIIPTYLTRLGPARFKMVLLPPLERQEGRDSYDVRETVQSMNDVFEPVVLEHIEEWYMLSELRLPAEYAQSAYIKALSKKNQASRR
ncbi:lysophospholipid acyltransferase family protein [Stappia sp. BW2]|uniref:lysophospholipid acyltransferase family protein n=1 Tax=Stappia sp. BW2 TaxID=2592622 RepID=UPI0011DE8FCB|nr:lysophospholipid acyltransferase family protein [Stappia sp. BW2]TYC65953.1 lysophospholipid acyltransferase family protein [Stappia sp. BW2]